MTQAEIRGTLAPIKHIKADTARKTLKRLNLCLKEAGYMGIGYR